MSGTSVSMGEIAFAHQKGQRFLFDIDFKPGCTTVIMGPSGSGKSTLLNLLAGFLRPQAGKIHVGGVDVTGSHPSQRPISMIFQDHNLFAHLDVARNVGLGIDPNLKFGADGWSRVSEALNEVGLEGYERRAPSTLSGGERQRVGLVRMLVRDRPVLLMDEALSSLGPGMRKSILKLVKQLQHEKKLTVIMVSHEPGDARLIADTMVFVRDGRIAAQAEGHEMLISPSDSGIADYLGIGG